MSCGVGRRPGSDPALLWLWHRPVATALIRPLAWEPPCAEGVAQEMEKKKMMHYVAHIKSDLQQSLGFTSTDPGARLPSFEF